MTGFAVVVDGDSLEIGGTRVRLFGIDAPELKQTCQSVDGEVECGEDAARYLDRIIGRNRVTCNGQGRDRFDRMVARCMAGEVDLSEVMVRNGWAVSTDGYHEAEISARTAQRGLWSMRFEKPAEWRERNESRSGAPNGPLLG